MARQYDELVAGRIFIGGEADAAEVIEKGKANVVFDLRVGGRQEQMSYRYNHIPITDEDLEASIAEGAKAIKAAYEQGDNIYLHCGSGGGRAGVMSVAVLQELGLASNLAEAEKMVKQTRPVVEIRPKMAEALQKLYK